MAKAPRGPRRPTGPSEDDHDLLRHREIYEKAKSFEERVAELFRLLGYQTVVDYKRNDQQFDVRLEKRGVPPTYGLVECKDYQRPVGQEDLGKFIFKVQVARKADNLPYQPIFIARSGFVNNAHEVARLEFVHLMTLQELLLSLVDLEPNLEAAIRSFQGTPLEKLYVEQEAVLEAEIRPGETLKPKGLAETVFGWLERPNSTFLALLGDFGCGKTSFCKRLAWELAVKSKEKPGEVRMPVLIDLREGGSTTVTLENLLTHHFHRLTNQPFNPQALLHLNQEGHLLLIFDGFDETIAYSEPGRYLENLRQILRAAEGKAKVLLTCRTHYFRDRPEALKRLAKAPEMVSGAGATRLYEEIQGRAGAEVGYVLEFREPQIKEYLQKALPAGSWKKFREQIRQTYNLEELAERPFLLEIIVKTLPKLLQRSAEVTLADLYETYCESWFTHTESRLTLTRDHKVALVEYLARLVWDSPQNWVHYLVLADKAIEFFKDRPFTVYEKERIDVEVRTALFLHRDAEGHYSFIHRSFLEFFIARTLRAGLAAGDPSCLALRRLTREVAFFLEFWPEAKRIPEVAGKVLEASYQAGISENALLLLYFHARATLGPLVGPGSEEENPSGIRETFSKMRPKAIHLDGADLEGAVLPGINLSDALLEGVKLARADLRQAALDRARLTRSVLSFADLRRGSAEGADLSGADLNHMDAQDAVLKGADLRNSDLRFARLTRAEISEAQLEGIQTLGAGLLGTALAQPRVLGLRLQIGHSGWINSVAWSPDGSCVATGSEDGTIKIWDATSGRLLNSLSSHNSPVFSVTWSPDGERIASGSNDNTIKLWESGSGRLLNSLVGHNSWVRSVAWSPDGERLASGSGDKTVKLWEASSGRLLNSLSGHDNSVSTVAWSPDGERLASASHDNTVRLWESSSGRLLNSFTGHENSVSTVAWSPDGERLASGSHDNTVKLWESSSGRLLNSFTGHENSVSTVAWSPDGERLASGSHDDAVKLWESGTGRLLNSLSGHDNSVLTVAWSPDGLRLASGSTDHTVKLWESGSGRLLDSLSGHDWVQSVVWSPDGQRLASGSDDATVKLWDAFSGRLLNSIQGHDGPVLTVAWSPDGERLASGSGDRTVKLWDSGSGRLLNSIQGHDNWILSVVWSPDGERLASGADDGAVKLWESGSGRLLNSLSGDDNPVFSVAWSPGGKRLASGSADHTIKLWESSSGLLLNSLSGHDNPVYSVAWSPDGERLASGSADHTVKLWESSSGLLLNSLSGHTNNVLTVAWSPTGERLASVSTDRTLRIWDTDSGEALQILEIAPRVTSLTWSLDGRRLALSFGLGFNEIWNLEAEPPRLLARLYPTPGGSGLAVTTDGYVSGPPEALEYVRFGDGLALYDLTDVPERLSPERVAAALNPSRGKPKPRRSSRARR